jgi:hypothetical protein
VKYSEDVTDEQIRQRLLKPLDDYIAGDVSFDAIYSGWYSAFFDTPDESLSAPDMEIFTEIAEQLDFTHDEEPDGESRSYGYISPEEFRFWLAEHRKRFD